MYQLQLTKETLQLPPNLKHLVPSPAVDGIYALQFPSAHSLICVRYGSFLIGYEYKEASGTWTYLWHEGILERGSVMTMAGYDPSRYPLLLTNLRNGGGRSEEVIVLRHQNGIRFFRLEGSSRPSTPPRLALLTQDTTFADAYLWAEPSTTFLWGRIFPDRNLLGLLTRKDGQVEFHAVLEGRVFGKELYPMGPFTLESHLEPVWSSSETEFYILEIQAEAGGDLIGLRTPEALHLYQVNDRDQLVQVQFAPTLQSLLNNILAKPIILRLLKTAANQRNILECDATGISILGYDAPSSAYKKLVDYRSERRESIVDCSSIQTIDINADGIPEVILKTESGLLQALSFHPSNNTWTNILQQDNLIGRERYMEFVGAIMPLSSTATLFAFESENSSLRTAHLLPHDEAPTTTTATTTAVATTIPPPPIAAPARSYAAPVPDQIPRSSVRARKVLRWAGEWDDSFLKETVEPSRGTVQFSVPLFKFSTEEGLGMRLSLSYSTPVQSQPEDARLLGVGWEIPLTNDRITVNYERSIFERDAVYTLHAGGNSNSLNIKSAESHKIVFEIPGQPEVLCTYYRSTVATTTQTGASSSAQHGKWVIESLTERTVYGNAPEAIEESLTWPKWRGEGRDWATLEPIPLAWHLTEHHAKGRNASLWYTFQRDQRNVPEGKSYTAAIRLIKVSDDGDRHSVDFEYGDKHSSEFSFPSTTDSRGNIRLTWEVFYM